MLSYTLILGLALLLLALEHFGVPIPGWATGIMLVIAAIMLLLGIGA
jgi:hypothetical protein